MNVRKAGQISRLGAVHNENTYPYSEEAIPFGAGVMRGTNKETQCKLMQDNGVFIGVTIFRQRNSYDDQQWGDKSTVDVLTRGYIHVEVSEPVVAGDKAACGVGGKFAKSGTASYTDIEGIFETSAEANGYAELRLR